MVLETLGSGTRGGGLGLGGECRYARGPKYEAWLDYSGVAVRPPFWFRYASIEMSWLAWK